jgi:hypothetical protein
MLLGHERRGDEKVAYSIVDLSVAADINAGLEGGE